MRKRPLFREALAAVERASDHLARAIDYRNVARDGDIVEALAARARFEGETLVELDCSPIGRVAHFIEIARRVAS